MNKCSEKKLNKRNKNRAKQTNRISATFDINNCLFHHIFNKTISKISNEIFFKSYILI